MFRSIKGKLSFMITLSLIMVLALTQCAFANDVVFDKEGGIEVIVDEEHLSILNDLIGKDITYKQLLEKVYPEAIPYTPKDVLENMGQTQVNWEDAKQPLLMESQSGQNNSKASVNCFSDLDEHGNTVQYYSWQYSTVRMPYMSVWSYLYYDPTAPAETQQL